MVDRQQKACVRDRLAMDSMVPRQQEWTDFPALESPVTGETVAAVADPGRSVVRAVLVSAFAAAAAVLSLSLCCSVKADDQCRRVKWRGWSVVSW